MRAWLLTVLTILLSLTLNITVNAQSPSPQSSGGVVLRGRVVDAATGEPIAKVKIIVSGSSQSASTDEDGQFTLPNQNVGEIELYITTVGYGLVKKRVFLKEGEPVEIKIALGQEAATLTEHVIVTSGPFERDVPNAASEQTLNKTELQTLSSVIAGDPVRAAQALPGVTANDDYRSEFAVRGLGFNHVGVYVDGVLADNFVHTVQGNFPDTGSLSVINGDTINSVSLLSGAYPVNFGDSTAAVLNLDTREGNRLKLAGRVASSMSSTSGVLDGPFAGGKGSWLIAARKSYLGYLVHRINNANDNTNDSTFDFADLHGKAIYDLTPRHQLGLSVIFGNFQFDRNRPRDQLGANSVQHAETNNLLVNAHWNYTPGPRLFTQTRVFFLRTNYADTNPDNLNLEDGRRTQVGFRSDISFLARPAHRVEAGVYVRSLRASQLSRRFLFFEPLRPLNTDAFDHRAVEQSYYLQDTWSSESLGLSLTGGGRVEHNGLTGETLFSPRASMSLALGGDWRIRAGFGRYYQFPEFVQLFGRLGNAHLQAERATHYNVSLERTLGNRTRVLAEAYDREDSNVLFSLSEPRVEAGRLNFTELPFRNALRGHARGIELTLQRRSANGLTGWVSYSYSKTLLRDEQNNLSFVSDYDSRHTLTVYSGYRFTETFNLSGQWRYGSGMPIPGFFRLNGPTLFLASERNLVRLPDYSRLDVRANKAFLFKKWKLTLTGEILNVLNRENFRYAGFDEFRASGAVIGSLDRLLPILPSAGIVIEF
jgi:outer membrane cobalamin receptor